MGGNCSKCWKDSRGRKRTTPEGDHYRLFFVLGNGRRRGEALKKGYLVVSRKVGERITVGEDIEILISDINEKKVDVAIKAPKEKQIKRKSKLVDEMAVE
jgi:carbon storage regulator CsrA